MTMSCISGSTGSALKTWGKQRSEKRGQEPSARRLGDMPQPVRSGMRRGTLTLGSSLLLPKFQVVRGSRLSNNQKDVPMTETFFDNGALASWSIPQCPFGIEYSRKAL